MTRNSAFLSSTILRKRRVSFIRESEFLTVELVGCELASFQILAARVRLERQVVEIRKDVSVVSGLVIVEGGLVKQ